MQMQRLVIKDFAMKYSAICDSMRHSESQTGETIGTRRSMLLAFVGLVMASVIAPEAAEAKPGKGRGNAYGRRGKSHKMRGRKMGRYRGRGNAYGRWW